ncbi:MAG: ABC1 kinase family protein [Acidimicrobiia bacterium]
MLFVILANLVAFGVGWLVARLTGDAPTVGPRRLRHTLEALGPTFMKLGQVLSTRPDLMSPAYEVELSRLQDAAPPVPWADIRACVTRALGDPPEERFAVFSHTPLAAASIGQVHAARLDDGTEVVVKVRRPGVVAQIALDLHLLRRAAAMMGRLRVARRFNPTGLATEFTATITAELDYLQEGHNALKLAALFRDDTRVRIPEIVWDHSADGVLTETRIVGAKVDDIAAIQRAGLDRAMVAQDFARAYLTMVFVHRFFHADPHPGNVFVSPDGVIGFVDFGMVGSVDESTGRALATVLTALVAADARALADALVELGVAATEADQGGLETDLGRLLDRYRDVPLQDLQLAAIVADLMAVVRRRDLHLPSRIALLLKTVVMCEGVAARLDPGFRLIPLLVPYAARLTSPPPPT